MHFGIKDCSHGGAVMKSPAEVLTAIAAAADRLSKWIGRSQAEQAKQKQPEIDRMDAEIQGSTKEPNDGTK